MEIEKNPLISIIIPVFNVESYLRKCLDSIVNQTYRNLEILIVDDGSSDKSGIICDEYKEKDERIRVFHTENRGLSVARNTGLDYALGQYIGFVDSDDWIEPDMYEVLMNRALETGADIVECGIFLEYIDRTEEDKRIDIQFTGNNAILALLNGDLSDAVWNKLWKSGLFKQIHFPKERAFEEIATTFRIFAESNLFSAISSSKYHYVQRKDGLSRNNDMKSVVGYWLSHRERFDTLYEQVEDYNAKRKLLEHCARAIARMWVNYRIASADERERSRVIIEDMNEFTVKYLPLFGLKGWNVRLRIGTFFPHFNNRISFLIAYLLNLLFAPKSRGLYTEKDGTMTYRWNYDDNS